MKVYLLLFSFLYGMILFSPMLSFDRRLPVFAVYGLAFVSAFFVLSDFFVRKKSIVFLTKDAWLLSWIAILSISSLAGEDPSASFAGSGVRGHGVIFFLSLWIISLVFRMFHKSFLIWIMAVAGLCQLIFITIIPYLSLRTPLFLAEAGRMTGTLASPNASAVMLAISVPLIFLIKNHYLKIIILIWSAIAIYLTKSWSGLISLLSALLTLSAGYFQKLHQRLIILFLFIFLVSGTLLIGSSETARFENRPILWEVSLRQIVNKPLFGYGAESGFRVIAEGYRRFHAVTLESLIIDRAHNLALDILIWSGVIGFIGFIIWIRTCLAGLSKNKYYFAGMVSLLIYSMFQPLDTIHWLILFLLLSGS